ncbi:MAG: queuosine precursor transporter [Pseudomonadota bacterium]
MDENQLDRRNALVMAVVAMTAVVLASNILVQYPVMGTLGGIQLDDVLTYGAFTYPLAFLVTDLVTRTFGPELGRKVAFAGFACAVILSLALATPRIAIASGTAFLCAQLFDVTVFQRLRHHHWWRAPLISSVLGSALDTVLFFTIAFTAAIPFGIDDFAVVIVPFFGLEGASEAPRWVSWAIADYCVKVLIALAALAPYRVLILRWAATRP